jgi:hypothetical protein
LIQAFPFYGATASGVAPAWQRCPDVTAHGIERSLLKSTRGIGGDLHEEIGIGCMPIVPDIPDCTRIIEVGDKA